MKQLEQYLGKITVVVAILLSLLSVIALINNGGLMHSEYNDQVTVTAGSSADYEAIDDKISDLDVTIVSKDSERDMLFIEDSSLADIERAVSEIEDLENTPEIYKAIGSSIQEDVERNVLPTLLVALIATILSLILAIAWTNTKISIRNILEITGFSSALVLVSVLLVYGFVSVLSMVYNVSRLEFYLPLISVLISATIIQYGCYDFRKVAPFTLSDLFNSVSTQAKRFLPFTALFLLLVIVPLYFSMGINMVVPSIIFALSLIIPMYVGITFNNLHSIMQNEVRLPNASTEDTNQTRSNNTLKATSKAGASTQKFKGKMKPGNRRSKHARRK